MSEFELIEAIKRKIPRNLQGLIPIGDDAGAICPAPDQLLVFTTDAIVEGVDFVRGKLAPELVGRKALAINLSDLAAMGAEPLAFTITLGIVRTSAQSWVLDFYKGLMKLAAEYNVSCVGGDITRSKQFFASVALTGQAKREEIVLRSGARSGDWIAVTGELGGSILKHHYAFEPRIKEARFLTQHFRPSAMMDISDGLAQDLEHILKASGCGAELDFGRIPISRDAKQPGLEHALSDGEDFELLFTVNPEKKAALEKAWAKKFPKVRLSFIGRIRSGHRGKITNLKLKKKGFTHF
jgi:thiamine-monophosphate kinase